MEAVKVSVICMAFNHGKYIKDALEGIVNQKTDFKFEVLVHDDASTDNTRDVIKEYEEKYPELIRPIFQAENQYSKGVIIESEFIIPRIRGQYVAICEGDDYWTDELKLQKQVDFLDANKDYSLVACSSETINCATGGSEKRFVIDEDKDIGIEELITEKNGRMFQTAAVLMKSEVFTDRKDWQAAFPYGDRPLWIKAGLCGKVRMTKDVMTVYRFATEGSWTNVNVSDDERGAINCRRSIEGFEAFDKATDLKYHELVAEAVDAIRFDLAVKEHDWKEIRKNHYDRFLKLSAKEKTSKKLRTKYYRGYKAIRKLLR